MSHSGPAVALSTPGTIQTILKWVSYCSSSSFAHGDVQAHLHVVSLIQRVSLSLVLLVGVRGKGRHLAMTVSGAHVNPSPGCQLTLQLRVIQLLGSSSRCRTSG